MSLEQRLLPAISAAVAPVPVYMLHAPQLTDGQPDVVPYVLLSRVGSVWSDLDTLCGANQDLCQTLLQVDFYALDLATARRMAEQVRAVFAALPEPASPDSEFDLYEPDPRVHHVAASYTVWDSDPAIA